MTLNVQEPSARALRVAIVLSDVPKTVIFSVQVREIVTSAVARGAWPRARALVRVT